MDRKIPFYQNLSIENIKCFQRKKVCLAKAQNLIYEFQFTQPDNSIQILNKYHYYESTVLEKSLEFQISEDFMAVLNPNVQGYKLFVYQRVVDRDNKMEIVPRVIYGAVKEKEGQRIINFSLRSFKEPTSV